MEATRERDTLREKYAALRADWNRLVGDYEAMRDRVRELEQGGQ